MSLLGIDFDIQGYIFKPFYLLLGVLYFIVLLSLLGALYIMLYLRNTLEILLNNIEKERNKYKRIK
jgi:uncharacterized membrane protein